MRLILSREGSKPQVLEVPDNTTVSGLKAIQARAADNGFKVLIDGQENEGELAGIVSDLNAKGMAIRVGVARAGDEQVLRDNDVIVVAGEQKAGGRS